MIFANEPWAILTGELQPTLSQMEKAMLAAKAEPVPAMAGNEVVIHGNTALIPIHGPLLRYEGFLSRILGWTSVEALALTLSSLAKNSDVFRIVLDFDSPGGQVSGIAELAEMIRAIDKPVIAFAGGSCASAAYWLASAADTIIMSKTAMVGSVGVAVVVRTAKDPDSVEIVSSQSPHKRPDVSTDSGRAQVQALVDSLAAVFVADVAAYRQTSPERVISDFGAGAVLLGQEAVARGMADQISTLADVLKNQSPPHPKGKQPMHLQTATHKPDYKAVLAQFQAQGLTRGQAIMKMALENPEAHAAMIRAANPGRDIFAASEPQKARSPQSHNSDFESLLAQYQSQGMSRGQAIMKMAQEHPEAHRAMIAAANGGRR